MARELLSILAFNRGLISRLGLARIDLKRLGLSAEIMTNWMPRVLGSMSIRPGLKYLGSTLGNAAARFLPFVFSTSDTALIELTTGALRIWIDDALLTRPSVTTAIANGSFTVDLTSWTDTDEAGATSSWVAPGYMQLLGDGTAAAIREQQVTAVETGTEHGINIVIARGPVTLRIGSTSGGDDYVRETVLQTGTHSLAITPTGNFFIRFFSRESRIVWVNSCTIEAAGVVSLPTPWLATDLSKVRIDQSGDVVFAACVGYQQRRIERRAGRSWSIVLYLPPDGPFRVQNVGPIALSVSALFGNITVTASAALFRSTQVGALFSITSVGQQVSKNISAQNTFTNAIRVVGVGTDRAIGIYLRGVWVGTVTLQRSVETDAGPWSDVTGETFTADEITSYTDGLDNQIIYYRIGFKTGDYTSGTLDGSLVIQTGTITGVVRITDYTNSTTVSAEVLTDLGGNDASTDTWSEGEWSDYRGWPSAVALHEGRLWWSGKGKVFGSISDAYDSFDPEFLGDAGPITRSIGSGPVDDINWMLPLQRLILGAQGKEINARSSSIDEPLTPTNFNMKTISSQGSGGVRPVEIDQRGVFVNRSSVKVFDISIGSGAYEYSTSELTAVVPDLGKPGIVRMDVQRCPDTRIHCIRSDGVAIVAVSDKNEDVLAWVKVETSGYIEDVVVLPALDGNSDDQVYYVVKRTINGATVRYLEKWAQGDDCLGDQDLCYLADAYAEYTGGATTTITGLDHLEGEEVVVWADGADVGTDDSARPWTQTYTVASGAITLAVAASNVVVGLGYDAPFKSTKLGVATQDIQSPLNQMKTINHLGLIMENVHSKGIRYGADFDNLDDLPSTVNGVDLGSVMLTEYDDEMAAFPGTWTTNSRLCMLAVAPRPCTMLAATIDLEMNK